MKFFARKSVTASGRDYATIALSRHQSAQGPILREFGDGRVVIDSGFGEITGRPMKDRASYVSPNLWMPLFGGI